MLMVVASNTDCQLEGQRYIKPKTKKESKQYLDMLNGMWITDVSMTHSLIHAMEYKIV